tara:strand:+ start:1028 stop:1456 length:429 start_codon:yes stop_codon:yes gene_type:complete
MSFYHPPNNITNNQSPIYTADLAYEGHGKCGNTRILTSRFGEDSEFEQYAFNSAMEGKGNAWRMDVIHTGTIAKTVDKNCPCIFGGQIIKFAANNISDIECSAIERVPIWQPFSIMADITMVQLDILNPFLVVVLYMDCDQS